MTVLDEIAPDIAGSGGFPGVERDSNHRRHNSPKGLQRIRFKYDAIVSQLEARMTPADFVDWDCRDNGVSGLMCPGVSGPEGSLDD